MQPDLTQEILELVRLTATDLPEDVERKLREAREIEEKGSAAQRALDAILENVKMAREKSSPICQDTGTPLFNVTYPAGWSTLKLREQINSAVIEATRLTYLRPNAVNAVTGVNTGDNTGGDHYPSLHFKESAGDQLIVELILKGGGCENVSAQYKLPDGAIQAGRDLDGVRKAALDTVFQAQGKGCAPGALGVAVGGDRGSSYAASKEALLRSLDDQNPDQQLADLEEQISREANELGIGPMGFGGKTTVLGTKIKGLHRLPASYFVSVSYMCWAYRRRKMVYRDGEVHYR
ncbi:MAG: fumarate hydratase [Anaerolineales bacterium]|nr:fumarate hydratase [Anaerolineales bacterium]